MHHHQDAHPSTAAIAGHPVHPMLVPIPIGALSLALASDLMAQRSSDRFWPRASRALLTVGLVGGVAAAPSGAIDFLTIRRVRELPEAWLHAGGNMAVVGLTMVNLVARRGEDRRVRRSALAMSAVAAGLLGVTGWLGGELSYRHRIGVMESDGADEGSPEDRPEGGQIDAFGGRSAIAVPNETGISPAEAETVARDLAAAELPADTPGQTGGG